MYTACGSFLVLVKKSDRCSSVVSGHCFEMAPIAGYPIFSFEGSSNRWKSDYSLDDRLNLIDGEKTGCPRVSACV